MSTTVAITFGSKYNHEPHPYLPGVTGNHFVLVRGTSRVDAVNKAFELTRGLHAFDYVYEEEGFLNPDFQRQIREYGYTQFDWEQVAS